MTSAGTELDDKYQITFNWQLC